MAQSNDLYNKILGHLFGNREFTNVTTYYVALSFNSNVQAVLEPLGNGYTRVAVENNTTNWSTQTDGIVKNLIDISFPESTDNWGSDVIKSIAIYDAVTDGNLLYQGSIPVGMQKLVQNASVVLFPAGSIMIDKNNIALELIDEFIEIAQINDEFNLDINLDNFIQGLFLEGLIDIKSIKLINDCFKTISKLKVNIKQEDINLICEKLLNEEKIKANIEVINVSFMCEYLKIIGKISDVNFYIDNAMLKIISLNAIEKLKMVMLLDDVKLINDCMNLINKGQVNLSLKEINLVFNKMLNEEKLKTNISPIDVYFLLNYFKTIDKLFLNVSFDNTNLVANILLKENSKSNLLISDINMFIKKMQLIKWRYMYEIEEDLISDIEKDLFSDIEIIIL